VFETVLTPIHRAGWPLIAAFVAGTILLWWLWMPLGLLGVVLTAWCVYFFRDPARVTPSRAGLMVSPADGVVQMIQPAVPPAELGLAPRPLMRISVFMNVFNVHSNRAPVDAVVKEVVYNKGFFVNASFDKASLGNERNALVLQTNEGVTLSCVQVAGLVARRILCYVKPGEYLKRGQRYGFIRFGSRVDVYLPPGSRPRVAIGDKVKATSTVLAELPRA
jgi:phosphatidylserine decarboxylase